MSLTKDLVTAALKSVRVGDRTVDLVSCGSVRGAAACDGYANATLCLPRDLPDIDQVGLAAERAVREACAGTGAVLAGLTLDFVDEGGAHVRTMRFGTLPSGSTAPTQAQAAALAASAAAPTTSTGHTPEMVERGGGGAQEHHPSRATGGGTAASPTGGAQTPQQTAGAMAGVKYVIAVGAGKGGVGKSTIAVNLAVGLARRGHAVGLLDADIYGPSLPTMLGLHAMQANVVAGRLQPFYVHGVKAMTIGKLVDPEKPLIWRGPMAHGAFKQLVEQTDWGELDYLILDLPPGTGDVSLTMAQTLQLTGAIVVCTPQRVAQDDAVRAARMFQQLGIEVLGVVENMSVFVGDDGKEYDIFGRGGAERMAARLNLPFLGAVPITMSLRRNSDEGDPSANFAAGGSDGATERRSDGGDASQHSPERALAAALEALVTRVEREASLAAVRQGKAKPVLTVS